MASPSEITCAHCGQERWVHERTLTGQACLLRGEIGALLIIAFGGMIRVLGTGPQLRSAPRQVASALPVRRLAVWLCVHLGHWVVVPFRPSEPIHRIVSRGISLRCPCGAWGGSTIMLPTVEHHPWEPWRDRRTGAYLPPPGDVLDMMDREP